jgi:hypothetical protein
VVELRHARLFIPSGINSLEENIMRKPTFGERLRYAFDNTLSRGTIALIGWLAVVSFALILAIALIVSLTRMAPDIGFA